MNTNIENTKQSIASFRICTLVTDWKQYEEMRESFLKAGFASDIATFSTFDNSTGNQFEPYSLINLLLAETKEPYLIVCHQDVLLDKGCGADQLIQMIDALDKRDPKWAVLGNAGCTDSFDFIVRVSDPTVWGPNDKDEHWIGPLPQQVHSLDENFLVLKTGTPISCSKELSGFHLYGTDLCLNARRNHWHCYVVDFRMTHLSAGNFNDDFRAVRDQFIQHWNRRFHLVYIVREADITLSRWKLLRRLGRRYRFRQLIIKHSFLRRVIMSQLG